MYNVSFLKNKNTNIFMNSSKIPDYFEIENGLVGMYEMRFLCF
jgi:hypothetical protein